MTWTSKQFWQSVAERAVMTFAQALVAVWGVGNLDLLHADWANALSVAGGAALLSVLKTLAVGYGTDGNPSFGSSEILSFGSSEILSQPGATADPIASEPVEVVDAEEVVDPRRPEVDELS